MALGGRTGRGAESGRREVTGRFGTGGLSFIGTEKQEQRNKDITGYEKEYRAGTTVGTASVGTKEVRAAMIAGDISPERGGSLTGSGVAIDKGVIEGRHNPEKTFHADADAHKRRIQELSTGQAAAAKGQSPATVKPISPGTPYSQGNSPIKIEIKLQPTGELSNMIEATTEVVTALS